MHVILYECSGFNMYVFHFSRIIVSEIKILGKVEEFEVLFMSLLDPPVIHVVKADKITVRYLRAQRQHSLIKVMCAC